MKLEAQTSGKSVDVEITKSGERVSAKIDGREYAIEASEPEPNVYLLKHNGRIHEFYVSPLAEKGGPYLVSSDIDRFEIRLSDTKHLRGAVGSAGSTDGIAEIKTMMPGKVVRLILSVGDRVETGDAVLVVEAMKMQNDLKSPKEGTVKDVRVKEGDTVSAGDILAVIE